MNDSPLPPPTSAADSTTGLTPSIAAGLACLGGFVTGILFLVLEKKNAFVRFWAMQSIIFTGAIFVLLMVLTVVSAVFGVVPVIGVIFVFVLWVIFSLAYLAALVVWIIMMIKAFTGKEWRMPWIAGIAEQQLARLPKG